MPDSEMVDVQIKKKKGRGFKDLRETLSKKGDYETLQSDSSGNAQRSVEGWIILVTSIHEEATEDDLYEKYAEFGDIKNLHLNLDRRTGYVKGYALLEFEHYKEAKNAIDATNGSELLGQVIQADFAFSKGNSSSKSVAKKR